MIIILSFFVFSLTIWASDELQTIEVTESQHEAYQTTRLSDSAIKSEVISKNDLEKKQSKNLIEAIATHPGVQIQNSDSICGLKRVQLNGLRGEYTTTLIDGIPLQSSATAYYGLEALSSNGVSSVILTRGTGATLLAPEAIGGTLDMVIDNPKKNQTSFDLSLGNNKYQDFTIYSGFVDEKNKRTLSVTAQQSERGQWDKDNNRISESPNRENQNIMAKYSGKFVEKNTTDFRFALMNSQVFGGPTWLNANTFRAAAQAPGSVDHTDFSQNDVRKKYIGDAGELAEIVKLKRREFAVKNKTHLNEKNELIFSLAIAQTDQDSFYDGADYDNSDKYQYLDIKLNHEWSNHILTLGSDFKKETMQSNSHAYYNVLGRKKDNFKHQTPSVYVQDNWIVSDKLELNNAIRVAHVTTDWTDLSSQEINRNVFAPRLNLLYRHSPSTDSRFSYGRGYRSPLTFFESEHGLLDDGYEVKVKKLETADSYNYTFSHKGQMGSMSLGSSWTKIYNISYVDGSGVTPALKSLSKHDVEVLQFDTSVSRVLNENMVLNLSYEKYQYQNRYKSLLPVASIEDRAILSLDYNRKKLDVLISANWIGARNLKKYNYDNHYNVFDGVNAKSKKRTTAPAYATFDLNMNYELSNSSQFLFGIKNLTNYTQNESPLFFNEAGDLEATHIWGPLQGRQFYLGLKTIF